MLQDQSILTNALIEAFDHLYNKYHQDGIYGCSLVLNEYMFLDYMMVSTVRSVFTEEDDYAQFLAQEDCWNTQKWRFRSPSTATQNAANTHLSHYFNSSQGLSVINTTSLTTGSHQQHSNLDIFLEAYQKAIEICVKKYGLENENILFFITMYSQPEVERYSAQHLNPNSILLPVFFEHKSTPHAAPSSARLKKLSQVDKDLLVDLAQLVTNEPYNYLNVANQVYILTLDSTFADSNPYIQKLCKTVVAMMDSDEMVSMTREEILERIDQFYSRVILER